MQTQKQEVEVNLDTLLTAGVSVVVTGLVLAFGLQILGDVQGDMTADSSEYNATADTIDAVAGIPSKLAIIVTVVVAVVIIGLLIRSFMFGKG